MSEVGRNNPCPCGSGLKYKRCCLPRRDVLARTTARFEAGIDELGRWARTEHPDTYLAAFAEFYSGGWEAFGLAGPDPDELLAADQWLTCDVPLAGGTTALESAGSALLADDVVEALAASALHAWRIEAPRGVAMIEASCLAAGDRVILETSRPPAGEIVPGALLVARAVRRDGDRLTLIGRGIVVARDAQDDFEDLFWQLSFDQPDSARLWRESGGPLASAALAWPEDREHTREGEIVCDTHVSFGLTDVNALVKALDDAPDIVRTGQEFWDDETIVWNWRNTQSQPTPVAMPDDLGVHWMLCDEDAADPPIDARIELNVYEEDVWLFAPAPRRLARCEQRLMERFGFLLGDPIGRGSDLTEIIPRWRRERWERSMNQFTRAMSRARKLAA